MSKVLAQNQEGRQRWMSAGELKANPLFTPVEGSARKAVAPKEAVQDAGVPPMPQVLAKIKAAQTPVEVDAALEGETRPQLVNAGNKRKAELASIKPVKSAAAPAGKAAPKPGPAKSEKKATAKPAGK